ncbi:MAG: cytochrome c [Candidatus Nitronauta litoralis]|uniref:Cytochrome c n=1 Tax=Candidatus Nitronauta litoralis TaxID=2705533 RepID=A0A7T0G096_9BACT|nr:MAG: cytochrome c [Candidatus Nitronauta litoralis]
MSSPPVQAGGQSAGEGRISLGLSLDARKAHNAIMLDHLEAIHDIVTALSQEEFTRAQQITENRLGFAMHRGAMQRQNPEDFPPEYHDLAMAHHHAAESLAKVIPSKNLKQILPSLEKTIKACVDCHRVYKH